MGYTLRYSEGGAEGDRVRAARYLRWARWLAEPRDAKFGEAWQELAAQLASFEGMQLSQQGGVSAAVEKYREAARSRPRDDKLQLDLLIAEAGQAFMKKDYDTMLAKAEAACR